MGKSCKADEPLRFPKTKKVEKDEIYFIIYDTINHEFVCIKQQNGWEKKMEELIQILQQVKPDVDFAEETALIDDGILESFDIIAIVNEINDAFDVEITVAHLKPENFNSAEAIWNLIQELQD